MKNFKLVAMMALIGTGQLIAGHEYYDAKVRLKKLLSKIEKRKDHQEQRQYIDGSMLGKEKSRMYKNCASNSLLFPTEHVDLGKCLVSKDMIVFLQMKSRALKLHDAFERCGSSEDCRQQVQQQVAQCNDEISRKIHCVGCDINMPDHDCLPQFISQSCELS